MIKQHWIFPVFMVLVLVGTGYSKSKQPSASNRRVTTFNRDAAVAENVIVVKRSEASLSKSAEANWNKTLQKLNVQESQAVFNNLPEDDPVGLRRITKLYLPLNSNVFDAAMTALQDPSVEWAEPLYEYHLCDEPNDPYLSYQWYLDQVRMPQAWDVYQGTGNVIIGIVDTGIDSSHADLKAALWVNDAERSGTPGFDDDHNGYVDDVWGWDFGESDNDPAPSVWQNIRQKKQYHGTWVAGVAGAVSNNGIGIASAVYHAKLLAIKVTEDDNLDQVFYADQGAEGIVYAADQGAKIINCSWGGEKNSLTEEAVAYATAKGSIVIAAASNENVDDASYPAAFPQALSVAATTQSDTKAGFSNYHYTVDISAPGVSMYTTSYPDEGNYGSVQGTSFSAPLVSSVAALVMGYRSDLTALQVREQVRVSADPIDYYNVTYAGKLGKGRLNAYNALTMEYQSLRLMDVDLAEHLGNSDDGIFEPGESIDLTFTLVNYLAEASGVQVTISVANPDVTIENSQIAIASMGTLAEWHNRFDPVLIHINEDAPSGQTIEIKVKITTAEAYTQTEIIPFDVIPPYATIEGGNVALTISSFGRLGYVDIDTELGRGFEYGSAGNLLFEGAILAGTHADSISDVARGEDLVNTQNMDFFPIDGGEIEWISPGPISDEQTVAVYRDNLADNPLDLQIRQRCYAFDEAAYDDFVMMAFDLINMRAKSLTNLYFALYMDWDIGDSSDNNSVGYDEENQLAYTYEASSSIYGGVTVLGDTEASAYRSYDNREELDDGFTDSDKYQALKGGIQLTTSTATNDYSQLFGVGPFTIPAGDTITVGLAVVGGASLTQLQQNAQNAKAKWDALFTNSSSADEDSVKLFSVYPNPFQTRSTLGYVLSKENQIRISIVDLLGREVLMLTDGTQAKGAHTVSWDGSTRTGPAASGVYFYRAVINGDIYVKKCIRLTD